jgi:hypothetical protein
MEFKDAARTMSTNVLPKINHLQKSVGDIVKVEGTLKTALTDLVKLSASVGLFGLPAIQ